MRNARHGDFWALVLAGASFARRRGGGRVTAVRRRGAAAPPPASALAATLRRVLPLAGPAHTAVAVLGGESAPGSELAWVPRHNVFARQPGASAAVTLWSALLRVYALDPTACVATFPGEHTITDDEGFRAYVRTARWIVKRHQDAVVLVGSRPQRPEPGCCYVEPGPPAVRCAFAPAFTVRGFHEPFDAEAARYLVARGALCTPTVLVARVERLLELIEGAGAAEADRDARGPERARSSGAAFRRLSRASFERTLLTHGGDHVVVLRADGLGWRDVGIRRSGASSRWPQGRPWRLPEATA